jgi:hypothetical protein
MKQILTFDVPLRDGMDQDESAAAQLHFFSGLASSLTKQGVRVVVLPSSTAEQFQVLCEGEVHDPGVAASAKIKEILRERDGIIATIQDVPDFQPSKKPARFFRGTDGRQIGLYTKGLLPGHICLMVHSAGPLDRLNDAGTCLNPEALRDLLAACAVVLSQEQDEEQER